MTLLEYVCRELIGEPTYSRGGGVSSWSCPKHADENPSFVTRTFVEGGHHRFKCFSCGWWGDELDLLKECFPHEEYGARLARFARLTKAFEKETPKPTEPTKQSPSNSYSGDGGSRSAKTYLDDAFGENYDYRQDEFSDDALVATTRIVESFAGIVGELEPEEKFVLMEVLQKSLEVCSKFGLHPSALAGQVGFQVWVGRREHEHMLECDDPFCKTYFCRLARGWTQEMIDLDIKRRKNRLKRKRGIAKRLAR